MMSKSKSENVLTINGKNPIFVWFTSIIDSTTSQALMAFLCKAVNDGHDEIHLFLSTPGGGVSEGVTIYNFIRAVPSRVVIYNMGTVASIGNVVYQAADFRVCARTSSFMFHGVGVDFPSRETLELKRLKEIVSHINNDQGMISQVIARHTNLSTKRIKELFLQMTLMRADEALDDLVTDIVGDIQLPVGIPIQKI